jgi:hypothetical protein
MFTEIEIQEIVDQWGQVYVPEGQTEKDIKKMIFTEDDLSADFRKVPNPGSIYKSAYATIDEVLQAFQIDFLPKGDVQFLPIEYNLGDFKVDVTLSPDKFRRSWLGFLAQLTEVDRAKWPFIRWYIQQMLMPRTQHDFIHKVAYYGWQHTGLIQGGPALIVDPENFVRQVYKGVHTPANATMDGIGTVLKKIQGRTNVITVGAWSSDPVTYCTQVENFIKSIPHEIRGRLDFLYVSKTRHELYREGKRLKYNAQYGQVMNLDTVYDNDNITVKGTHAMKGSNKHWITIPENRVKPVQAEKTNQILVERNKRVVDIYGDWAYSLVMDVPEFVFQCDNELEWTPAQLLEHYGITV